MPRAKNQPGVTLRRRATRHLVTLLQPDGDGVGAMLHDMVKHSLLITPGCFRSGIDSDAGWRSDSLQSNQIQ